MANRTVPFYVIPISKIWTDYDEEANVLHISFKRPQKATNSEMLEMVFCSDTKEKKL